MKKLLLTLLLIPTLSFANVEAPPQTANSKLEQTVIGFLEATEKAGNRLVDATDKAIDFASSEIPIVIKEYLDWHFYRSLVNTLIGVFIALVSIAVLYFCACKLHDELWEYEVGIVPFLCFGLSLLMLFIIVPLQIGHNTQWIKITVAPRVFLIDQFSHLIK
jgi:hypothetical protein